MHRTQILLEQEQYERLMRESQRLNVSLSELIRRLVQEFLARETAAGGALDAIVGIGRGSGEPVGREHNHYLYGPKAER